jgi:RNA polymerase sigma factor (TIGR02999 family)
MNQEITGLLNQLASGDGDDDGGVGASLVKAVVDRLERIAARELAQRNRGALDGLTMEPRMFAHDALLKVIGQRLTFDNRRHFFAYATQVMVREMVDYHRARRAQKRGGEDIRVSLSDAQLQSVDVEELPPLLSELQALDSRKADVVRLRVFWGADNDEVAELLGVSPSTVDRDWRFARRWLATRLRPEPTD